MKKLCVLILVALALSIATTAMAESDTVLPPMRTHKVDSKSLS